MKKIIVWGCGTVGEECVKKYGKDKIDFFIEQNRTVGAEFKGLPVLNFQEMLQRYDKDKHIIFLTMQFTGIPINMLKEHGIDTYIACKSEEAHDYIKYGAKVAEQNKEKNSLLDNFAFQCSKLDLISNVSEFKELTREVLKLSNGGKLLVNYKKHNMESTFYGNGKMLMDYAGIPEEERDFFPIVSHIDCLPNSMVAYNYRYATITSGNYLKTRIHQHHPYVPVFPVGPYIHYTEGIYSPQELSEKKKLYKKTLLIVLPHSIESADVEYEKKKFIDDILEKYKNNYDTFFMCVYWADILDPICDYAEENGIKVVSAGFRFDQLFSRRLRTILELADSVVCGEWGTFIIYSMYFKKTIARMNLKNYISGLENEAPDSFSKKMIISEEIKTFEKDFFRLFVPEFGVINEEKLNWGKPYNDFSLIRTKEYIRDIFEITKNIWQKCNGDLFLYPNAVRKVFQDYYDSGNLEYLSILKDAVGSFLD